MKPFLHGKKAVSIAPLRHPASPSAAVPGSAAAAAMPRFAKVAGTSGTGASGCGSGEANVEVIKEGDKVVRMVVTCSCGERIEIECLYPSIG